MKKKLIALCLIVVLAAVAVVGGTLAYFTDADKDVNVMVSGNVEIVQNETDREGKAYVDNQKLMPAVYVGTLSYDGTATPISNDLSRTFPIWNQSVNGEIDKFITVTNKGTEAAYVRTIILMENTADNKLAEKIHGLWCDSDGQYRRWLTDDSGNEIQVSIGGVNYSIAVCTYNTALASGATTDPSLMQIFLDPSAENEWADLLVDSKLNIIAISQAVQVANFDGYTSAQALDTAFGTVTAENVLKWYNETGVKTTGELNVVS